MQFTDSCHTECIAARAIAGEVESHMTRLVQTFPEPRSDFCWSHYLLLNCFISFILSSGDPGRNFMTSAVPHDVAI